MLKLDSCEYSRLFQLFLLMSLFKSFQVLIKCSHLSIYSSIGILYLSIKSCLFFFINQGTYSAKCNSDIVVVRSGIHFGLTFHPELSDIAFFHNYIFTKKNELMKENNAA